MIMIFAMLADGKSLQSPPDRLAGRGRSWHRRHGFGGKDTMEPRACSITCLLLRLMGFAPIPTTFLYSAGNPALTCAHGLRLQQSGLADMKTYSRCKDIYQQCLLSTSLRGHEQSKSKFMAQQRAHGRSRELMSKSDA